TRPYRPQTNGKVERFNRTLLDQWAYARPYHAEAERREAFPQCLHTYNHHRGHSALKGQPPASRAPNLPRHSTYTAGEQHQTPGPDHPHRPEVPGVTGGDRHGGPYQQAHHPGDRPPSVRASRRRPPPLPSARPRPPP